ncbi:hypothetical protein LSG31_20415 [Fodinisporobacter ferrooxydans]|uniref:Uncharacterized protein n=1 Tax=Fodinisporobacter ferrooxydans TaxID=2901836 RepID=A0ABY4CI41_9BACL|nr:hypothetical protein LSG31_20415 [Alicyclobacillaceae bacterium MYW30-H2]
MYGKCVLCQEREGVILSRSGQPFCLTCISELSPDKERLDTNLLIFCGDCAWPTKIEKEQEIQVIFGSMIRCKNCNKIERISKELKDYLRGKQ